MCNAESQRWQFRPFREGQRSPGLIVSFAGGALKFGGHTQREFFNILTSMEADALFLVDDLQSFYLQDDDGRWQNYAALETRLREFLAPYQGVLFIGASMGASAALMFAHLSTCTLSFAPFVDLDRDPRIEMKLARYRFPARARTFIRETILRNAQVHADRMHVHCGTLRGDLSQVQHLEEYIRVDVHEECNVHGVAKHLRDKGELLPLLRRSLQKALTYRAHS